MKAIYETYAGIKTKFHLNIAADFKASYRHDIIINRIRNIIAKELRCPYVLIYVRR